MEKAVKCAHPEVTVAGYEMERHETLSYALMFQCLLNDAPPQYPYIDSLISVPRCIAAPGCSSLL